MTDLVGKGWAVRFEVLIMCISLKQVVPGETALAFYKAKNPTDKPVIGISTYNVVPFEAGQYFNKIQVQLIYMQTLVLNCSV